MSSDNEIHFGDFAEQLIKTVESKPALYNKEINDKRLKEEQWTQVCEIVVPMWDELSSVEKALKKYEIKNKWRNLVTAFNRELKMQNNSKFQKNNHKRRRYIYFKQLLFLKPKFETNSDDNEKAIGNESNHSNSELTNNESNEIPENSDGQSSEDYETETLYASKSVPTEMEHIEIESTLYQKGQNNEQINHKREFVQEYEEHNKIRKIDNDNDDYDDEFLFKPTLEDDTDCEIDEDKMFMLSLVPALRKINGTQKFDIKIEFLSIIKRALQTQNSNRF